MLADMFWISSSYKNCFHLVPQCPCIMETVQQDTMTNFYSFAVKWKLVFCKLCELWSNSLTCCLSHRARGEKKMNALQCARYVYQTEGVRGFYRGLTASYAGISETMICFLIYETLKKRIAECRLTSANSDGEKGASDFLSLMVAAAFAKGCASCIAYPHGTGF